jgi:plasmid maintenance system antidote protein VapI
MNAELIEAMSDKQYSAITLARLMNVPLRTIERWVSEGVTPRPPNAIKLNDLLGRKIYEVKQ